VTRGQRGQERSQFLNDCLITFIEGGPYSWFIVRDYKLSSSDEASAKLLIANPHDQSNYDADPDEEPESWLKRDLTVNLIAHGLNILKKGAVEGLHEAYRSRLLAADSINDAGDLDINDVDIIVQVATLGSVVYA
jgi:hypothetical protein